MVCELQPPNIQDFPTELPNGSIFSGQIWNLYGGDWENPGFGKMFVFANLGFACMGVNVNIW